MDIKNELIYEDKDVRIVLETRHNAACHIQTVIIEYMKGYDALGGKQWETVDSFNKNETGRPASTKHLRCLRALAYHIISQRPSTHDKSTKTALDGGE